jgi:hypothetical protein
MMTALNFILQPNRVVIFMDTLALGSDKNPFKYASKIFPLPHLRGVLCGTGSLNTIMDWHKYDLNETNEATIYHFGFDPREEEGRIKGFAFRSTNNFLLEELKDGVGIKPGDNEIIRYLDDILDTYDGGLEDLFINIMKLQKKKDDEGDPKNRIGIGGAIHMFHLNKNRQFLWECYNFDDYDETFYKMLQREGITRV